jgi:hypothetical protein
VRATVWCALVLSGCFRIGGDGECVPGRQIACDCPGGGQAIQVCQVSRTYGRCDCPTVRPDLSTAGTVDAGASDAAGSSDGSTPDAGSLEDLRGPLDQGDAPGDGGADQGVPDLSVDDLLPSAPDL